MSEAIQSVTRCKPVVDLNTTCALDALVLADGESKRMGSAKALLPLGNTTLVGAVVAVLRPMFRRVLMVARNKDELEGLGTEVLTDDRPERGPLVGLARGLTETDAPWCFVVGCDMPFLRQGAIEYMAGDLNGCDILVPQVEGWRQPLHAFYSPKCLPYAEELLDRGATSLRALFSLCRVRQVSIADLLHIDPDLMSFTDLNTMGEYQAALQKR